MNIGLGLALSRPHWTTSGGAASFTPAWQQFPGNANLYRSTNFAGSSTTISGLTIAMTLRLSATDVSNSTGFLHSVSDPAMARINKGGASNRFFFASGIDGGGSGSNSSLDSVTDTVASVDFLILAGRQAGTRKIVVVRLDTGAVFASQSDTQAGPLPGISNSGWIIGGGDTAGSGAMTSRMERVQLWTSYADVANATVQGYFHAAGALKDPAVAIAALGTPVVSVAGTNLQSGTNAGSGGNLTKTGAGTITSV